MRIAGGSIAYRLGRPIRTEVKEAKDPLLIVHGSWRWLANEAASACNGYADDEKS
jgi:hypothetical protein